MAIVYTVRCHSDQ